MTISIVLSDRRFSLDRKRFAALARRILKGEKASGKSLNIVYCSDKLMTELNNRFKKKNRPTDVLAFEMSEAEAPGLFIGEIYINLQQAKRQAIDFGVPYKQEVERLTIHGILHLLGYRDGNSRDRKMMWSRQEGYL